MLANMVIVCCCISLANVMSGHWIGGECVCLWVCARVSESQFVGQSLAGLEWHELRRWAAFGSGERQRYSLGLCSRWRLVSL